MIYQLSIILTFAPLNVFATGSTEKVDQIHQAVYDLVKVDLDSALILTTEAQELSEKISYQWGKINSYYIKAYIYRVKKELASALLMNLKASYLLDELEDDRSVKMNMDMLLDGGSILRQHHKYIEAIEFYDKALSIGKSDRFPKRRLKLLINKASAFQDKGDMQVAIDVISEAIPIAENLEDQGQLIKCWNLLGIIHKDNGDYSLARKYYSKILSGNAGDRAKAKAYHNIAVTYIDEGDLTSAKGYLELALELKTRVGDNELLFVTVLDLLEVYILDSNWKRALIYAEHGEIIYNEVVNQPNNFVLYHFLDTIHHSLRNYNKAQHYSSRYFAESKKFYKRQKEVIKLKNQFQMDLLVTGFYQEIEGHKRATQYKWWIVAIVVASILLFLSIVLRRKILKRQIEDLIRPLTETT